MDDIAVYAAARGNLIGYPGRLLEVRSAGEDAWLGRPAPYDPSRDGHLTEETALPSDDLTTLSSLASSPKESSRKNIQSNSSSTTTAAVPSNIFVESIQKDANCKNNTNLASWHYSDTLAASMNQRTSFRCLKEAMTAARDGDRILLRQGIHNGLGESIVIKKRVLIQGEGQLGDTTIDQRANSPTIRIERGGAVLSNIYFDHTGFCEALCIKSRVKKGCINAGNGSICLIDSCKITCSGDDALNTSNTSSPYLRFCTIGAKKCGIRAYDQSSPRLEGCTIENCGEQGVKAMEQASIQLFRCTLASCSEEGLVTMNAAAITLDQCVISRNKGPGVDCSEDARVVLRNCKIDGNVGGVWVWDAGHVEMEGCVMDGGNAHVVLVDRHGGDKIDDGANIVCKSCTIKGDVYAPNGVLQSGLLGTRKNTLLDPGRIILFPSSDSDPFRFVPSPYTRLR